MRKRYKKSQFEFQKFEERICLTVSAAVSNAGSLFVHGDADGPVQIVATGEHTFDVADNGALVGTFENVTKNIVVGIDSRPNTPADDSLAIRLDDQTVDNVLVRLGHGDNQFGISGDEAIDRVIYLGGAGSDTLTVDVDTEFMAMALMRAGDDAVNILADSNRVRVLAGHGDDTIRLGPETHANVVSARLGDGDNSFFSNSQVRNRLFVRAGLGDDIVGIGEDAAVGGKLNVVLGHGDNTLEMAGTVLGRFNVLAGLGNDTVAITSQANIGHRAIILAGSGDNQIGVNGNFGGNLFMRAGFGNDTVRIGESATLAGSVGTLLGAGDNTFGHEGSIEGNLVVLSKNPDDVFISNGFVGGRTILGPGDQGDRGDGN